MFEVFTPPTAPSFPRRWKPFSVPIGYLEVSDSFRTFVPGSGACHRCSPPPATSGTQSHLEPFCALDSILGTLDPFLSLRKLQPLEKAKTGPVSEEVWDC